MLKNYPFIRLSIISTCILYFASILNSIAQDYSQITWYFGQDGKAIQFNKNDFEANVANGQHVPLGEGGSAMAVDPVTGNILFYSDGVRIYDATGQIMSTLVPGDLILGGDPASNQPVAIIPLPGKPDNYYVIVNTGNGITTTQVDMTEAGNATTANQPALGAVVPPSLSSIHNGDVNEAMIVIPGESPDVYYLLVQNTDGEYILFTFDADGSTSEVQVALGPNVTAANFAYNEATGQIAVSPSGPNEEVQILNFDPATGALTFQESLAGTGGAGGVYDSEWSEDGSKLYISTLGAGTGTGNVFQYAFDEEPPLSEPLLPNPVYASYGLKIGPDNKIYHLYQATAGGPYIMGVINDPDSVPGLINYDEQAFSGTSFSGKQFPEITPAQADDCTVDFNYPATACQNAPISFLPVVDPSASSFSWDFGNGSTSDQQSPIVVFEEPGPYTVTLEVECGGVMQPPVTHVINITASELTVSLQDTTMCDLPPFVPPLELEPEVQGEGSYTYTWSNGDGTPSNSPNSPGIEYPGFYWVVVTDQTTGCTAYAGATVKVYKEENRIANIWYFGEGAGIDFGAEDGTEAIPPGPENQINAPEGAATMSDPNGDVLFYTDGVTVWDKNGSVMPNGADIGGSQNATQSAIIIPFPDDETLFYIFTPGALYGDGVMRYSIVDIKANSGLGDVDPMQQGIPLFSQSTERVSAIEGGPGYLLLTHDFGNNTFRVYPIGPDGIGAPVMSSIGSVHSTGSAAAGEGYMKFSPGGEKIAVALPPNIVEVFDFVDSTLKVTNHIMLELDPGETPYGIEFSPSGDMLYVSVNNNGSGPSTLYQYALVDEDGEPIEEPQKVAVFSSGETFGALQIGSDQQMYMAVNGAKFVYRIAELDNNHTINPISTPQPFDLAGGTSSLGLPNFIQSLMQPPGDAGHEDPADNCIGNPVQFVGFPGYPDIDKAYWEILKDDAIVHTSDEFEFEYVFEEEGEYEVIFAVSNHCETNYYKTGEGDVPAISLTISGNPDEPTLPANVPLCEPSVEIEAGPETEGLTYEWSNGKTDRLITVTSADIGTLSVEIFNEYGCSSEAETLVWQPDIDLDLGEDKELCQDDPADRLDTFTPNLAHVWTINGVVQPSTNRYQTIDTSVPGTFEYVVSIAEDPEFGECVYEDRVVITVNPAPVFSDPTIVFTECNDNDGQISLNHDPNMYNHELLDPDGNLLTPDADNPLSYSLLPAGMYTLTVTDNETDCSVTELLTIRNDNSTAVVESGIPHHGCEGEGRLEFRVLSPQFPVDYRLFDMKNNVVVRDWQQSTNIPVSATDPAVIIEIDNLASSHYQLEIRGQDGCLGYSSDILPLEAQNSIDLDVPETVTECVEQGGIVRVTVTDADPIRYDYTWTREDGTSTGISDTNQDWVEVNEPGFYSVTVSDPDGLECPTTKVVEVQMNIEHTVHIEQIGDACDGVVRLRAVTEPSGSYTFRWSHLPLGQPHPQEVDVFESMTVSVSARNPRTSCNVGSDIEDIVVEDQNFEVTLAASSACEDAAFTLTASASPGTTFTFFAPDETELYSGPESTFIVGPEFPSGEYTVRAVSARGCPGEARSIVSRLPAEEWTQLPEQATICILDDDPEMNSIELNPGGNFQSYSWTRPDGGVSTGATINANQPGLYIVTMTSAQGCTFMDSTEVRVDCQPAIFGPNAFSPNGNDLNETFSLHTRYISDFDIKIFNRWGELIFHDTKKDFEWDGTYKGELVQNGTYPYLIRYRSELDSNTGFREHRGGVTVVK